MNDADGFSRRGHRYGPPEPFGRAPPVGEDAGLTQMTSRFVLSRFADIKPLAAEDYCVKGLLPRSGLAIVWGPPKCGKSFWTSDLLMHIALGWRYRGLRVKQGPVVYVCLEGAQGFRKGKEAFRRAKLTGADDPPDPPFFLVTNPVSLAADAQALIDDIKRQVGEGIPAAVCIDTLNRSLAGSENSDEDMAAYIRAADAVRDAFDCVVVVVVVHHCGHNGDRPRGHSSLLGAADVIIAVKRDAADNIVATVEDAKDGPTGLEIVSRLVPVDVAQDEDGDAMTVVCDRACWRALCEGRAAPNEACREERDRQPQDRAARRL
jgi:AAA domain